ncbi:hypothetical protein QM565_33340, partial [Geitlerinema splendidum]|nr:hypothetical protein [Geitlerinema splendidum]
MKKWLQYGTVIKMEIMISMGESFSQRDRPPEMNFLSMKTQPSDPSTSPSVANFDPKGICLVAWSGRSNWEIMISMGESYLLMERLLVMSLD